jgi:hypothetical protein
MSDLRQAPRMAVATLAEMLAADDPRLWIDGAPVWQAWLTAEERMALFASIACALPPAVVADLAVAVVGAAGMPAPSSLAPAEDARFWTGVANTQEVRAYTLAGFVALSPQDRRDFLATARRITGEVA